MKEKDVELERMQERLYRRTKSTDFQLKRIPRKWYEDWESAWSDKRRNLKVDDVVTRTGRAPYYRIIKKSRDGSFIGQRMYKMFG